MNARQLALPVASALTAVAVLRLWHHADLGETCTTQDELFVAQPRSPADTRAWAVRAQVRAWGGLGASAWWVNLAQAAVLAAWSQSKANAQRSRTDTWCVVVLALLVVWGDWHLVSGRCDPGVTPCGDARYELGGNSCAYPVDGNVGVAGDPVPHGCLACDATAVNMGAAGAGLAALAVAVVAAAAAAA